MINYEEHRELGRKLKAAHEDAVVLSVLFHNSYPAKSQGRKMYLAMSGLCKHIDGLRCWLEELMAIDNYEDFSRDDRATSIYYGGTDHVSPFRAMRKNEEFYSRKKRPLLSNEEISIIGEYLSCLQSAVTEAQGKIDPGAKHKDDKRGRGRKTYVKYVLSSVNKSLAALDKALTIIQSIETSSNASEKPPVFRQG